MNTGSAMGVFQEYRVLLWLHLRTQLGLSSLRTNWKRGKGRGKTIGVAAAVLYAAGMMLMVYLLFLNAAFRGIAALEDAGLAEPGLAGSLLGAVLGSAMLVSFVFGSITLFSVVFHARDAALYASMPLRPGHVFAAKFSTVYAYELLFVLLLALPAGVMYCAHTVPVGGAFPFWLRLIPVVLTLPMTPLALASLAALGLSRVTRGTRRYERWNLVFQLLILAAALAFQVLMNGPFSRMMSSGAVQGFLLEQSQTLSALPGWFPPAAWAGMAVTGSGLSALGGAGLYAFVSAGCMALALGLAGRVYYRSLQSQTEVPRSAPRGRERVSTPAAPHRAIARKEWRSLFRTPAYVMNVLIGPFIMPLIVLMMSIGQRESTALLLEQAQSLNVSDALMALILGVVTGLSLMISGAATLFSREGRGLEPLKALPLTARDFLRGKLSCYRQIGWLGVLLTAALLLFLRLDALPVLAGALMAAAAVLPITESQALRDCASPKLEWENETQAVKQNLNALFGMLAALITALPIAGAALVMALMTQNIWLTAAAAMAVSALLTIPLRHLNVRLTERLLRGRPGL